jgi:hypothetical protein
MKASKCGSERAELIAAEIAKALEHISCQPNGMIEVSMIVIGCPPVIVACISPNHQQSVAAGKAEFCQIELNRSVASFRYQGQQNVILLAILYTQCDSMLDFRAH